MAGRGQYLIQRTLLLGRRCRRGRSNRAATPTFRLDGDTATASALSGKRYGELLRGWMVFKLLSYNWMVEKSLALYSISKRLLGLRITERLLRATVAGQFLGGFSEEEAGQVADALATKNMCSIWNFSTEQDISDSDSDQQMQEARFDAINCRYLKSIQLSGQHNYQASPVKSAAVKLTAIVNPSILSKLSQMLVAARQHKEGSGDMCELSAMGDHRRTEVAEWMCALKFPESLSVLHQVSQAQGCRVAPFSGEEEEQLSRLIRRLDDIGECAREEGVRVLVDAEESRLQPAVRHLTVHHMMPRFNLAQPFIYNTIQMYLKNSFDTLLMDITTAKISGFSYGIKLVRGAYMEYEKEMAAKLGHTYPVQPDKEATHRNYDRGMRHIMEEIAGGVSEAGVGGVIVASHNQHSVEQAVQIMQELGIPRGSGAVCFGQLLGMGDHLSYPLAQAGYIVQKFLAYGGTDDVFPFLVRRGQENDKTSENAQLERQLYAEEMKRRWW